MTKTKTIKLPFPTAKFPFALVKTRFHRGGPISKHRTYLAALKAAERYRDRRCDCGCCAIVTLEEFSKLPMEYEVSDARAIYL